METSKKSKAPRRRATLRELDALRANLRSLIDQLEAKGRQNANMNISLKQLQADNKMLTDHIEEEIRVLRVIEYVGPRSRMADQIARSVQGTRDFGNGIKITAATLYGYPEILTVARKESPAESRDTAGPAAERPYPARTGPYAPGPYKLGQEFVLR